MSSFFFKKKEKKNSFHWEYFWNHIGRSQGFSFTWENGIDERKNNPRKVNNGQWFNCVSVYAIVCAKFMRSSYIHSEYAKKENANAILIYSYNSIHFHCIRSGLFLVSSCKRYIIHKCCTHWKKTNIFHSAKSFPSECAWIFLLSLLLFFLSCRCVPRHRCVSQPKELDNRKAEEEMCNI